MRDAFPLPPNRHGYARTGMTCQHCSREIVFSVEDHFQVPARGSKQRFCTPACRQAAYRRRRALVAENAPPQRHGGRGRKLSTPPASGAKSG